MWDRCLDSISIKLYLVIKLRTIVLNIVLGGQYV